MSEDHIDEALQEELLNLLGTRNRHFKLEAGHHGNLWLDLDPLFICPKDIQFRSISRLPNEL